MWCSGPSGYSNTQSFQARGLPQNYDPRAPNVLIWPCVSSLIIWIKYLAVAAQNALGMLETVLRHPLEHSTCLLQMFGITIKKPLKHKSYQDNQCLSEGYA
jgi:hypothetical protein